MDRFQGHTSCNVWVVVAVAIPSWPTQPQPCLGGQLVLSPFSPSVTVGAGHRVSTSSLVQIPSQSVVFYGTLFSLEM